jgi:hypothetical protein
MSCINTFVAARPGILPLFSAVNMSTACESWRMLLRHFTRRPASRARFSAGNRIAISTAMIPMTTSSSTSVKPACPTLD